jgi:hypothetical protein
MNTSTLNRLATRIARMLRAHHRRTSEQWIRRLEPSL